MNTLLKNKKIKQILLLIMILSLSACGSKKDILYFQDELSSASNSDIVLMPEITYKVGDMLTIDVSALDPEAAKPFNLPAVSYNSSSVISAQGNLKMQTYLIDTEGNIEFPVLGTLKIGGLSRIEAKNLLKERLSEYLKDPIVNIRISNFTISVLGEVNKPGTYIIQDENVSLTEALGLAGDLTIYGVRNNVFLIREVDGKKKYAKLDLTSVDVLNSPNYYLTQNDVIYVEQNKARVRQSAYNQNNVVIISAVATLATIAAILIK
jgi:polysaccharide export outer membrane protein